jgi:mRNA-degrading endonuclease RelE of RelBE toxin-antitoxin system
MAERVILELTDTFRESYRKLPQPIQAKIQKQLRFLAQNPQHRSLHMHRLNGEWEFYVDVH